MASSIRENDWSVTLRQILQKPSAVSAVVSLGAHVLLFALLPLLPDAAFTDTEPEIRRSVEVVELTPEEQSRLPEFSDTQIELPPLFNDPLLLPDANLLPLPEPGQTTPPPGGFFSDSLVFPPLPSASIPSFSLPVPPAPPPTISIPTPRPSLAPAPQVSASPSVTPSSEQPPANTEQPDNSIAANSETAAPEASPQVSPTEPPPQANEQWREELVQARLAEIRRLRQQLALLAPDATATGEGEPLERYTVWFEQAVTWLGDDYQGENAEIIDIEVPYPEIACARGLSGAAIIGVLVDAEGNIVEDPAPELLQGAGYRIFNEKALEAAQAHPFEATGSKQAYQVRMKFEYKSDSCPENPELS